jgi:uncharacterized protein (DUF885 family)
VVFGGQFLDEYWRLHPVEATHAGVRQFDGELPDLSRYGLDDRTVWIARQKYVLERLDKSQLTPAEQIDRKVLLGELSRLEILDAFEWPQRAPFLYVEQAMQGLNYLLSRPNLAVPEAQHAEQLRSRLAAIPALLTAGRANLRGDLVPEEFVEIALVACAGADTVLERLDGAEQARIAVADFSHFLKTDLRPEGSFALGPEFFERLLREQHGLDLTPDEVYRRGQELSEGLLGRLDEFGDWQGQIEALKADHPTVDTLLDSYAAEAARARAFVEANHLVPIPPGEQFEVRPTAAFLRATTPLGHFDKAPPFAADDNLGILYITPIDASLDVARQQELLSAHCHTAVRAICLHETFPGHHVQLWHAKLRGSPVRRQFQSSLFTEGWALYCEELMQEAGYYDTPGLALWRLKNAMWRAVRLMVDVGLHCRGLDLAAAARPLVELGGLEPNTARGESLRYTTTPTQPSSYVLGRDLIVALRRQASAQPGFTPSSFHDWLLGYSSVSPAFIRAYG